MPESAGRTGTTQTFAVPSRSIQRGCYVVAERSALKWARIHDPLQWKLSPMELESYRRWYQYSKARDVMLKATNTKFAPWNIVRSDDKRRARLNCVSHILKTIPSGDVPRSKVKLPKRSIKGRYDDQASLQQENFVGEIY